MPHLFVRSIIQRKGSKNSYRREALALALSITTPRPVCNSTQPEEEKGSQWPSISINFHAPFFGDRNFTNETQLNTLEWGA